jgi:hypothetical protein
MILHRQKAFIILNSILVRILWILVVDICQQRLVAISIWIVQGLSVQYLMCLTYQVKMTCISNNMEKTCNVVNIGVWRSHHYTLCGNRDLRCGDGCRASLHLLGS